MKFIIQEMLSRWGGEKKKEEAEVIRLRVYLSFGCFPLTFFLSVDAV